MKISFGHTSFWTDSILNLCFKQSVHLFFIITLILFTTSCTKSPDPDVTDLIKVRTPTFTGLTSRNFTSASTTFTLAGECDPISRGLDWSRDGTTWTQFATDCASGTFSTNITLTSGQSHIRVRAKGKFSNSASASAHVRFLLPPTEPSVEFVQSSASDNSDNVGRGVQSSMNLVTDGIVITGPTKTVTTSVPGAVYGQ